MSLPETIVVHPTTTLTHTVVFLHGRGDTADHFKRSLTMSITSQGQTLQETFPSFRWVYPRAVPQPTVSMPRGVLVSQWFDVANVKDFSDREELQAEGLRESVANIRLLLAQESAALGGRWDRIILMGISQGAATSVHTLVNLDLDSLPDGKIITGPRKLAAFIGFSCRMPFPDRSLDDTRKVLGLSGVPQGDEVLKNTPMLLEHCMNDPLVLLSHGRALCGTLQGFGAEVDWREYPKGGHWFNSPAGMDDVVAFLNRVLAPSSSEKSGTEGQPELSSSAMDLS